MTTKKRSTAKPDLAHHANSAFLATMAHWVQFVRQFDADGPVRVAVSRGVENTLRLDMGEELMALIKLRRTGSLDIRFNAADGGWLDLQAFTGPDFESAARRFEGYAHWLQEQTELFREAAEHMNDGDSFGDLMADQ